LCAATDAIEFRSRDDYQCRRQSCVEWPPSSSVRVWRGVITNKEIERGSKVLYAHLGGQPELNAYSALLAESDVLRPDIGRGPGI
jgi:hypothetical protein